MAGIPDGLAAAQLACWPGAPGPPPVEYAVAVDRFLASASLSESSRRVYRISLACWAWALVGGDPPDGRERRGAAPPVVPLALLDDDLAALRLAAAADARAARAGWRTVSRELSALRSAVGWWQDAGWIQRDPTVGLRNPAGSPATTAPLSDDQLAALFASEASLREQAFWHLLHDSGAPAAGVLRLDASSVDRAGQPRAFVPAAAGVTGWSGQTADLLAWLLSGRSIGPVFLTSRRAAAGTPGADVCPLTRQARMSYRRAAEIFTSSTRSLDPHGRGWTLRQLRPAQPRECRGGPRENG